MQSVRTAVVGASGYSGQELLHYLARHPVFHLCLVTSRQNAGRPLSQFVHGLPRELGGLVFVDAAPDFALAEQADLFFLALPHGAAAPYVVALREAGKRVVDLSADFRTTDPAAYNEFYGHDHPAPALLAEAVYGIPEIHRERLKSARLIAAPGCFPTSIILPLAPFLRAGWIETDSIVVTSLSGVSGAGRKLELRLLFGEITDNMYAYGVPKHRHLGEIEQELSLAAGEKITVTFTPHLVPMHRGMLSTITARSARPATDAVLYEILEEAYGREPFVEVLPPGQLPEARHVANSNRIQIAARVDERTNRLLLFSSLDNLGKGNASQAIQAANLASGLDEKLGLA
ncbi:MAG TPA: N-acetyl-gamma-glutamyl-phosphate reductase [Candidatus Methylacidiphilales bacterium]|nr:N-acetyl-gamma-glutamyl-phosphate reductase [Candidatus Methylacidiphilales bacterium]